MGQSTTADTVRARRIEVLDDEGRVRAVLGVLGVGDDLRYGLGLYNETGRQRAWITTEAAQPKWAWTTGATPWRASWVADNGHPSLNLFD